MYTKEQTNFIIYHNRSFEGVTSNFLPKVDVIKILDIQEKLNFCRSIYSSDEARVDFEKTDFLFDEKDIVLNPEDLNNLKGDILEAHKNIKKTKEYKYLKDRGITDKQIKKYAITPMSLIKDEKKLDILGCTTHPLLGKILGDGVKGGGVIFPLFEKNKLVNICLRRIENVNKMKYGLAVPDINLWGIENVQKK